MTRINGSWLVSMLAAGFAVFFVGCTAFGPMPTGATCTGDPPDDSVACTVPVCSFVDGAWSWRQSRDNGLCPDGEVCHLTQGCVPDDGTPDCNDGVACTADSYNGSACVNDPVDSRCPSGQRCGATGCYTPPVDCSGGCDDGVACTIDSCSGGTCRHIPDHTECAAGQHCTAAGCVNDTPPTGDFRCVYTDDAHRIGYAVRVRSSAMSGVRTIPSNTGETRAMSASRTRLWALGSSDGSVGGAGIDTGSDGWTTYSLVGTAGGRINVHPYVDRWRYGAPEFERDILNIADLRSHVGSTCASLGIEVQTCMNPSGCGSSGWVDLPARFCVIGPDTVDREFWNDPVIASELRGTVVRRALIATDGSNDTSSCEPVITD